MGSSKGDVWDDLIAQVEAIAMGMKALREKYPECGEFLLESISQAKTKIKSSARRKRVKLDGNAGETKKLLVAHYCEEFKTRYGVNPMMTGPSVGMLGRLLNDVSLDRAKQLVSAFIQMNDQLFTGRRHEISLLVSSLNKVSVFADSGQTITRKEAQRHETLDQNVRVMSRWLQKEAAHESNRPGES